MSKEVIVIGGGIIGLCSAYYLQKDGHKVTVIDQSSMDYGASYVNAGYISPSHIIPLSAPGTMKKGLKWMFNPSSPLYIKPRLELDFLKWVWAFNKSCNTKHVKKAIPAIKEITLLSQKLYHDIKRDENLKFQLEDKGLLMLCKTEKMLEEEMKNAKIAMEEGLETKILSQNDVKNLEPNVSIDAIGAAFYKCDSHSTPHEFMNELKALLIKKGVIILDNEKVEDLMIGINRITAVITHRHTIKVDEVVLAAGSWSSLLSKKLGIKILLEAGKGYRINTTQDLGISIPAILAERKVAVTPMHGFTRFSGTMEIAGINHNINKVRVKAIANAVSSYYPDIHLTSNEKEEAACGLRPVSPDGLPYIGRSSKCNNLVMATGHAMMGWSMATATAKSVSEIISNKSTSLDLNPFHPDRRF